MSTFKAFGSAKNCLLMGNNNTVEDVDSCIVIGVGVDVNGHEFDNAIIFGNENTKLILQKDGKIILKYSGTTEELFTSQKFTRSFLLILNEITGKSLNNFDMIQRMKRDIIKEYLENLDKISLRKIKIKNLFSL